MAYRPMQYIIEWVASRLKIPHEAIRMLRAANSMSGLGAMPIPTELIPLNSIQLARGVLNYTVLQSHAGWVRPFWAVRQYDPDDPAFVPRSHLGLSVNVTHRNWTGVGNPGCAIEPIVDPRGLVTPFPPGWSIDTWCLIDGISFFPSSAPSALQHLVEEMPVVETVYVVGSVRLVLTTYTTGSTLHHQVSAANLGTESLRVRTAFALRPFNPEGVSLIHNVTYDRGSCALRIDGERGIKFSRAPELLVWGSHAAGDCAGKLAAQAGDLPDVDRVHCAEGLANCFAAFDADLESGESAAVACSCALDGSSPGGHRASTPETSLQQWRSLLAQAPALETPDPRVTMAYRASISTLLMLVEGPSITPGPCTYHQFWFRDAAYMLWALDKLGYHELTRRILTAYPSHQERSGYFRSQRGEWDSNGQALWSVWQHMLLSASAGDGLALFDSLDLAAHWIDTARVRDAAEGQAAGLLPAGLSAEHLGLPDVYFWDDFWSLAGIQAFRQTCSVAGKSEVYAAELSCDLRASIESAITRVQAQYAISAIPGGPNRGIDVGMIGSCCAWYPLQLFPGSDRRMAATLETLWGEFMHQGLFFQSFIHSGMNAYLTLQIAHAFLYAGDRTRFWTLLQNVLSRASSTLNYPEAIHPSTGGGVMGDGHHGWAAAEVALALRDAFVFESWGLEYRGHDLVFLSGIPPGWFRPGKKFALRNAPVAGGRVNIDVSVGADRTVIAIGGKTEGLFSAGTWIVRLPGTVELLCVDEGELLSEAYEGSETLITLMPRSLRMSFRLNQTGGLRAIPYEADAGGEG